MEINAARLTALLGVLLLVGLATLVAVLLLSNNLNSSKSGVTVVREQVLVTPTPTLVPATPSASMKVLKPSVTVLPLKK